jgi:voltage-gated potassium channel
MRKRIFEIIELSKEDDKASSIYDCFMLCTIMASLIPLAFKNTNVVFLLIERAATVVFIIDYCLRLLTADYKANERSGGRRPLS